MERNTVKKNQLKLGLDVAVAMSDRRGGAARRATIIEVVEIDRGFHGPEHPDRDKLVQARADLNAAVTLVRVRFTDPDGAVVLANQEPRWVMARRVRSAWAVQVEVEERARQLTAHRQQQHRAAVAEEEMDRAAIQTLTDLLHEAEAAGASGLLASNGAGIMVPVAQLRRALSRVQRGFEARTTEGVPR